MANYKNLHFQDSLKASTNNQNIAFGLFNKLEDQYQTKLNHYGAQQLLLKKYQEVELYDKDRINNMERVEQENATDTIARHLTINEKESRQRGGIYYYLKIFLLILSIV